MDIKIIKHFLFFLKPYRVKEFLLFILMIISIVISLAMPWFLKIIIDDVLPNNNFNKLLYILLLLFFLYILRLIISYFSDHLSTWLGNKVVNDIKLRLYANLLEKPIEFFDKNSLGEIIQKTNHETHKIQGFITHSLLRLVSNTVTIIFLIVVLSIFNYKLFLIAISLLPLSVLINKYTSKKLQYKLSKISQGEGDVYNSLIDSLKNIKLIRMFDGRDRELSKIRAMLKSLLNLYTDSVIYSSLSRSGSGFLISIGTLIVLGYGGYQVMMDIMTIGSLVAFIQYLNRIYGPANDLIALYVECISAEISMKRIYPLLLKEENNIKENLQEQVKSVKLKHLKLNYSKLEVLQDFSFEFKKGNVYALVGRSGSGKSSILNILSKYYDHYEGEIVINNQINLRSLNLRNWLDKIVLVHQDTMIFEQTIYENILYGNPNRNISEIKLALQKVQLYDFVESLPLKLNTKIGAGDNGIHLSGGQKQQLSIARALMKNHDVLLLDEATSAMDSSLERKVFENLFSDKTDKIIIIISHRLSAIFSADEIIFLNSGKVVETGSHDILFKEKGFYYNLFESQVQHL